MLINLQWWHTHLIKDDDLSIWATSWENLFMPYANTKGADQEKESIIVLRCELKIPSLGITVRHQSASLVMPNSYPRDGIFSQHLTIIKDPYSLAFFFLFFKLNKYCMNYYHFPINSFLLLKRFFWPRVKLTMSKSRFVEGNRKSFYATV